MGIELQDGELIYLATSYCKPNIIKRVYDIETLSNSDNMDIGIVLLSLIYNYVNSDLYSRNLLMSVPHNFTTNEQIYKKYGIYTIEYEPLSFSSIDKFVLTGFEDLKNANKLQFNYLKITGNTDILKFLHFNDYSSYLRIKSKKMTLDILEIKDSKPDFTINWDDILMCNLNIEERSYIKLFDLLVYFNKNFKHEITIENMSKLKLESDKINKLYSVLNVDAKCISSTKLINFITVCHVYQLLKPIHNIYNTIYLCLDKETLVDVARYDSLALNNLKDLCVIYGVRIKLSDKRLGKYYKKMLYDTLGEYII